MGNMLMTVVTDKIKPFFVQINAKNLSHLLRLISRPFIVNKVDHCVFSAAR